MEKQFSTLHKIYLTVLAIFGWFALIGQLYLIIEGKAAETPELLIRYFSYFTIDTNLIVAICCTMLLIKQNSFFKRVKTLTAITLYISVVGIIYNIILRALWKPEGLQLIIDELLHSVIPVLFLVYWLLFVVKSRLKWNIILPWMIYPLVYVIFVLIRGSFSGFYPYPFLDMNELGAHKVLVNSVGITLMFVALSLLFVWIGNLSSKRKAALLQRNE